MHGLLYKMAESEDKTGMKPNVKVYVYATRNLATFNLKRACETFAVLHCCMNCLLYSWFSHSISPSFRMHLIFHFHSLFVTARFIFRSGAFSWCWKAILWRCTSSKLIKSCFFSWGRCDTFRLLKMALLYCSNEFCNRRKNPRYENVGLILLLLLVQKFGEETLSCVYIVVIFEC